MAELVDWLHHESITRAATNTANGTIGKPFGNGADVCPVCGKPSTIGRKTNADRIRMMSDEELAERMSCFECVGCPLCHEDCVGKSCKDAILEWLKKEVEE